VWKTSNYLESVYNEIKMKVINIELQVLKAYKML